MYFLISLICLHVVQAIIASVGNLGRNEWFFWDATNILTAAVLSWLLFNKISYKDAKLKLASFVFFLMMLWSVTSFILLSFFFDSIYVTVTCVIIMIIPVISLIKFWKYSPKSDKYLPHGSYLVFKRPRNLLGLLAVTFCLKGSSVSVVSQQKEYIFEGGANGLQLREKTHIYDGSLFYKRVEAINAADLTAIIGKEWKPWRTCFHIFRKYDKRFKY